MIETRLSPSGGFSVRGHEVATGLLSFTYTAGVCTDCGGTCVSQMVAMDIERHTCHARCGDCHSKAARLKAETADPSWFAAEERATR